MGIGKTTTTTNIIKPYTPGRLNKQLTKKNYLAKRACPISCKDVSACKNCHKQLKFILQVENLDDNIANGKEDPFRDPSKASSMDLSGGGGKLNIQKGGYHRPINIRDPLFQKLFTLIICCVKYLWNIPFLAMNILKVCCFIAILATTYSISASALAFFASVVTKLACVGGKASCLTGCFGSAFMSPGIGVGAVLGFTTGGFFMAVRYTNTGSQIFNAILRGLIPTQEQQDDEIKARQQRNDEITKFVNRIYNYPVMKTLMDNKNWKKALKRVLDLLCGSRGIISKRLKEGASNVSEENQLLANYLFIIRLIGPYNLIPNLKMDGSDGKLDDAIIKNSINAMINELEEEAKAAEEGQFLENFRKSELSKSFRPDGSQEANYVATMILTGMNNLDGEESDDDDGDPTTSTDEGDDVDPMDTSGPNGGSSRRRIKSSRRTSRKPRNKRKTIRKKVSKTRKRTLNKKAKKRSKKLKR